VNFATFGASTAAVGSDTIDGGEGHDAIGGDALAVTTGAFYGEADAHSLNFADVSEYGATAQAGNDVIYGDGAVGDGGEGTFAGQDSIGGDAIDII
jgi:hypothetical protein